MYGRMCTYFIAKAVAVWSVFCMQKAGVKVKIWEGITSEQVGPDLWFGMHVEGYMGL